MDSSAYADARPLKSPSINKAAALTVGVEAADKEAIAVLNSIAQLARQLEYAISVRDQKANLLSQQEDASITETIESVEEAGARFGSLLSRPQKASVGKTEPLKNDPLILWNSSELGGVLHQINLASQKLTNSIEVLMGKGSMETMSPVPPLWASPTQPPPSYEESNFLIEKRAKNLRRQSANSPVLRPGNDNISRPGSIMDSIPETAAQPQCEANSDNLERTARVERSPSSDAQAALQSEIKAALAYRAYRPGASSPSMSSLTPAAPSSNPQSNDPNSAVRMSEDFLDEFPVVTTIPRRWTVSRRKKPQDSELPQSLRISMPARKPLPPRVPPKPSSLQSTSRPQSSISGSDEHAPASRSRCLSLPEAALQRNPFRSTGVKTPDYLSLPSFASDTQTAPTSAHIRRSSRASVISSARDSRVFNDAPELASTPSFDSTPEVVVPGTKCSGLARRNRRQEAMLDRVANAVVCLPSEEGTAGLTPRLAEYTKMSTTPSETASMKSESTQKLESPLIEF